MTTFDELIVATDISLIRFVSPLPKVFFFGFFVDKI